VRADTCLTVSGLNALAHYSATVPVALGNFPAALVEHITDGSDIPANTDIILYFTGTR